MLIIKEYLQNKVVLYCIIGFLVLTNIFLVYACLNPKEKTNACNCSNYTNLEVDEEKENSVEINVDIKGKVKKPGVYTLKSGAIVNDLIKLAGGLKSDATTENINLSKRLKDEDVVIVLSKAEFKKKSIQKTTTFPNENNSSKTANIEESVDIPKEENQKVSLNKATKEELMTLNGIGESKAQSIIEYRLQTPFQEITDIKNVSGIGESVYEKIKDFITV